MVINLNIKTGNWITDPRLQRCDFQTSVRCLTPPFRLPFSSFALARSLLPTPILLPLILSQRCVTSLKVALNSPALAKTKTWWNSMTIAQGFPLKLFFFFSHCATAERKCVRVFSFSFLSSRPKPFVPLFNTTVSAAPEPLWSSLLRSSLPPPPAGCGSFLRAAY